MDKKKKFNWGSLLSILLIIVTLFIIFYFMNSGNTGEYLELNKVQDLVYSGSVQDVYVQNGTGYVRTTTSTIEDNAFPKNSDYYFTYNNTTTDLQFIETYNDMVRTAKSGTLVYVLNGNTIDITVYAGYEQINYSKTNPSASILETILPYISLVILIVIGFLIFKLFTSKGGAATTFNKSRAKLMQKSNIKFTDIAGADEEKEETAELVEFLKDSSKFKALGARIPKGVLLVGPPGTGKTLLAKAVAGESNVPFFSISGSDFVELYVGVGASRVRDLFETAKRNAPCIIFIDEIDAVGRQRGAGLGGGNDEREQTLNQLLVEMDGFNSNEGIIVLAATNRADVLDPALLRPGRFDRQIYVNVPDVKGREGIIRIHAKNKPIDSSVKFNEIARLTSGFTGADIENFLNEAAILAARKNSTVITMEDITEGINKVLMGPQKKSRLVTEKDKKLTAYHEGGHAIVANLFDCGDKVHEVSIIPRGMAGGYTSTRPADDDEHYSIEKLNNRICMLMGGRIAEEIIFKDFTAGASSDIKKATDLTRKMVAEWGMSKKLGFLSFGKSNEVFIGRDYQTQNQYSEHTATIIDEEIKSIIDENYKRTKQLLLDNQDKLENLANLLLLKETIYQEEVEEIMSGKNYLDVAKDLEKREIEKKIKDQQIRKQHDFDKAKQLFDIKIKAAQALVDAGVISNDELDKIKQEGQKDLDSKQNDLGTTQKNTKSAKSTIDQKTNQVKKSNSVKKTTTKKTNSTAESTKAPVGDSKTKKKSSKKTVEKNSKDDK